MPRLTSIPGRSAIPESQRGAPQGSDTAPRLAHRVAVLEEGGREVIIGGGRYVVGDPGSAELAFVVVDQFHRQGVGAAPMRHLAAIARAAGLKELTAEVLAENIPMLRVLEKSGLRLSVARESGLVRVGLRFP